MVCMRTISFPMLALALLLLVGGATALWYEGLEVNVVAHTGELDVEFYGQPIFLDACGLPPGPGFHGGWDWVAYPPGFEEHQTGVDAVYDGHPVEGKDVGCTNVTLLDTDHDGDDDTMQVTLENVYPYYYTKIDFEIHNNGDIPVKIWRLVVRLSNGTEYKFYEINADTIENEGAYLDLDGDNKPDIVMWWGDNFGVQLEHCQRADISLNLIVLQTASENTTYTFQLQLDAVQWNEYTPGPIGD